MDGEERHRVLADGGGDEGGIIVGNEEGIGLGGHAMAVVSADTITSEA